MTDYPMKSTLTYLILLIQLFSAYCLAEEVKNHKSDTSLSSIEAGANFIRIGFLLDHRSAHHAVDALGDFYGIDVDYMSLFSQRIGVKFKYFSYKNVDSAYKALLANEIDAVMTSSTLLTENSQLVKSDPIYQSNVATWFLQKSRDGESKRDQKVGCISGGSFCTRIENGNHVVEVDDFYHGMRLVLKGEIDGFIDSYAAITKYLDDFDIKRGDVNILEKGATISSHLVVNESSKSIIPLVNLEINRLKKESATLPGAKNLYHQNDQRVSRFISSMKHRKVVRYSIEDNLYPLFYRDMDGDLSGYIYDFLQLLENRSGLEFEYIANNGKSISEMMKNDEIDFVPIVQSFDNLGEHILRSEPYINIKYVRVKLRASGYRISQQNRVGILARSNIFSLRGQGEELDSNVYIYSDIKEMLDDLDNGKISSAIMTDHIAKNLIIRNEEDRYKIDVNTESSEKISQVSLGVSANKPLLLNALNSVLNIIDENEVLFLLNSYKKFDLIYGYEKSVINSIALAIIILIISIAAITVLGLKNLKLQVNLRKVSEDKVKEELLWLQEVINELPDMIVIRDKLMNVVLANEKYKKNKSLIFTFDNQPEESVRALSLEGKDVYPILYEGLIIRNNIKLSDSLSGITHLDLIHKSVVDPVSQKRFILSIYQDVSVMKQQEIRLIEANRRAEKAMSARSQFLANMSHELRTPIAGMLGLLELLRQKIDSKEALHLVENIHASSCNLQLLVNDVLDFSKIEANQIKLDVSSTEILKVVGGLLRSHQAAAKEKNLAFEVEWKPFDIEFMDIDTLRFSQVINNLMSNAIKFTDEGTIRVSISVEEGYLNVQIADSGIGIEADKLSSIFKPFEQADGTIARKYGGTGLGLSIVNSLVSLLQGDLKMESAVNKGTTVYLRFPIVNGICFEKLPLQSSVNYLGDCKAIKSWLNRWGLNQDVDGKNKAFNTLTISHNDDDTVDVFHTENSERKHLLQMLESCFYPDLLINTLRQTEQLEPKNIITFDKKTSVRVLVAEDNAINRVLIEKQLESIGVLFKIVADGEQAYQELERASQHYHMLLTDYHMPNLDGLSLAYKVRQQLPEFSNKRIIGMTAEVSKQTDIKIEEGGFDHILYKPYTLKELASVLLASTPSKAKNEEDNLSLLSEIFVQTMSHDRGVLAECIENYDDTAIKKIVHRIKGGAISVGVTSISDAATQVESLIIGDENRDEVMMKINDLINAINKEVKALGC